MISEVLDHVILPHPHPHSLPPPPLKDHHFEFKGERRRLTNGGMLCIT